MADDDLDRLLDEVESKYCHPGTGPRGAAAEKTVRRTRSGRDGQHRGGHVTKAPKSIVTVDDENVDDLIEDILDVRFYEESKQHNAKSTEHQSCKSAAQHPSRKCCPVYLGGSGIPFGIGTSISERACDQLRCTTCDFNIVTFDDYKWDVSCDYLFFRNSMPEHSKLQTKMVRKKGARAYACQCSWRSIQQVTHLSSEPQLRWVCGKHPD